MQALSEEDRRLWMEAMDGREPVGYHGYHTFTVLFLFKELYEMNCSLVLYFKLWQYCCLAFMQIKLN